MRGKSIRNEFLFSNFGLQLYKPEAFCECQWRWPAPVYLMYRLATAVYTVFGLTEYIVSWLRSNWSHHILVFMTTWTYILLTAYFLLGAILALVYFLYQRHFRRKPQSLALKARQRGEGSWIVRRLSRQKVNMAVSPSPGSGATSNSPPHGRTDAATNQKAPTRNGVKKASPSNGTTNHVRPQSASPRVVTSSASEVGLPWYIQVYWFLGNTVQVWAVVVTIIFFAVLFPAMPNYPSIALCDVNVHALNTGFMLLDAALGARPVRMLHALYPILFGIAYVIFSVIYWSRDTNYNVVYENVLNWNRPGVSVGVVCGMILAVVPLLQLLFVAAFRLRLAVFRRVYKEDYFLD